METRAVNISEVVDNAQVDGFQIGIFYSLMRKPV